MKEQNLANHARLVPGFHFVLFGLLLVTFIGSLVNLTHSWGDPTRFYSAALIVAVLVALFMLFGYVRIFPLVAQDRAIRAEENLRHYVLTGKLLDTRLSAKQIVALRFAGDAEFVELARQAADSGMEPRAIKEAIKHWRADHHRV